MASICSRGSARTDANLARIVVEGIRKRAELPQLAPRMQEVPWLFRKGTIPLFSLKKDLREDYEVLRKQ